MSTKELIEAEIAAMDERHLDELYALIKKFSQSQRETRIGGLNPGSISTTEDFDEPSPDEFRLSETDKL